MKGCLLFVAAVSGAMALTVHAQVPATVTPESLVKAAKRAAGVDYAGTFLRICVAPDNLEGAPDRGGAPPARTVPDRKHLVSCNSDTWCKSRSAAPGWQGETSENIWNI